MKRLIFGILVALIIPACMPKTANEKRWDNLDGDTVILLQGYEKIVHSNPECPMLKTQRGAQLKCKVKNGRLVDEGGNYMNGPEERFALCTCVK